MVLHRRFVEEHQAQWKNTHPFHSRNKCLSNGSNAIWLAKRQFKDSLSISLHRDYYPGISTMSALHQAVTPRPAPSLGHRLFLTVTWILKGLLLAGVPMGPMVLLTVRGRKSGKPRTTPVDLFERNGRSFLVSTHRQESSNWVRNLRAAGEGIVGRGHSRRSMTAMELPPETAGQVLKEVVGPRLASPMRGFVLRRTFSVAAEAPLADYIEAAHNHPVFEIVPKRVA